MFKNIACWSCGWDGKIWVFLCPNCHSVQSVQPCSAFQVMGIPVSLDIDEKVLEKNYLERQQQLHPDHFIKASATEQLYATQQTANINRAYNILKDRLTRAEALLAARLGVEACRDEQAPNKLLMQLMEVREALETSESLADLESLNGEVVAFCSDAWNTLRQKCLAENWSKAQEQLIRVRYWQKMLQKTTEKLALVRGT
ncbi:MAG: Fe-S protein assembly co-chaperone HscB [Pseudomonadota bacterium]